MVLFHYVFSVSFIVVSNARIVLSLVALVHVLRNDYSIPLSSAVIQSDVQYKLIAVNDPVVPLHMRRFTA